MVSQEEIDQGVEIWDTNVVWPMSNPDEFPYMYSLESEMGSSVNDMNFVTVSPGFYASNVSFPDEDDLDEFIAADCEAIGDGNRFYEIVNESDLKEGYIRLEIQADPGSQGSPPSVIFENYYTENAMDFSYLRKRTG